VRPFVKRFALRYRSVVCMSVLSCLSSLCVCDVRALWPNGWTDQDETWHAGRPRPWPHCVRWGPSSPSPKGRSPPPFSAHICCGQMAAWIKMSHGMEVGLDPGDVLLDGDPAPPPKRGAPPKFSAHVYCGQTAGWMKLVLGMEVGLNPGDFVLDGTQSPSRKGDRAPLPNFRPISIVAKRLDASKCHLVWMLASTQGTLC